MFARVCRNIAIFALLMSSACFAQTSASPSYTVQVLVPSLNVRKEPSRNAAVIAQIVQGAIFVADQKKGDWYRIVLATGEFGWIQLAAAKQSMTFSVDTAAIKRGIPGGQAAEPGTPETIAEAEKTSETEVLVKRPMGQPLQAVIPPIDPSQVPAPSPLLPRESLPVPDRWRIMESLGLKDRWFDPYNQNTLKGDKPVFGADWFFVLGLISDSLFEARRLPTPIGAQSSDRPGANDVFGKDSQSTFNQNLIVSLALIKGNTTFKPPDYEFRFVPVFNFNRTQVEEVRALRVDPRKGKTRNDQHVGVQELFVDKHLRNVSERYDFDSLRVGIQPFISDFRGFLFQDNALGVRLFGNRDDNKWQYNLAWFRRVEKDTNSGLNDLSQGLRKDDVWVANLYRQDFPVLGFTTQGTVIHNRNQEAGADYYDNNGFLVRPAVLGDVRAHNYQVTYLGLNGDGHMSGWNITAAAYYAFGKDERHPLAQREIDINAFFAALELSRDFSWLRIRGTGVFASGDKNPFDDKATGFDAILENPQISGADTSFWIRQAVPLIGGGGVSLSGRNGILPSLRSSKDQGQSNFVNPGLILLGIGADVDVLPQVRVLGNVAKLWFVNTSSLAVLRNQGEIKRDIGVDVSAAIQYRPFFTQNIVLNLSAAALIPGKGLKQLYDADKRGVQYSVLFNVLLSY